MFESTVAAMPTMSAVTAVTHVTPVTATARSGLVQLRYPRLLVLRSLPERLLAQPLRVLRGRKERERGEVLVRHHAVAGRAVRRRATDRQDAAFLTHLCVFGRSPEQAPVALVGRREGAECAHVGAHVRGLEQGADRHHVVAELVLWVRAQHKQEAAATGSRLYVMIQQVQQQQWAAAAAAVVMQQGQVWWYK